MLVVPNDTFLKKSCSFSVIAQVEHGIDRKDACLSTHFLGCRLLGDLLGGCFAAFVAAVFVALREGVCQNPGLNFRGPPRGVCPPQEGVCQNSVNTGASYVPKSQKIGVLTGCFVRAVDCSHGDVSGIIGDLTYIIGLARRLQYDENIIRRALISVQPYISEFQVLDLLHSHESVIDRLKTIM